MGPALNGGEPIGLPGSSSPVANRSKLILSDLERAGNKLEEVWRKLTCTGLPIVYSVGPEHCEALFLWRGNAPAGHIPALFTGESSWKHSTAMKHLAGTGIWHAELTLPFDLRTTYSVVLVKADEFSTNLTSRHWRQTQAKQAMPDQLNPNKLEYPIPTGGDEASRRIASILEMPGAPPRCTAATQTHERSSLNFDRIESNSLGYAKSIAVFEPDPPAGRVRAAVIILDGQGYTSLIPTPSILSRLIAEAKIPPVRALFVDSFSDGRRAEEFAMNPAFSTFLSKELPQWHNRKYGSLDMKPVLVGSSLVGLAAVHSALDTGGQEFHAIICQSGSFWWPEALSTIRRQCVQFIVSGLTYNRSCRMLLEAGSFEDSPLPLYDLSVVDSNRQCLQYLHHAGVPAQFNTFSGGHDVICWTQTLPAKLIEALG